MKNPQALDQNSKRFRFYGLSNCKGHNPFFALMYHHVHFEKCLEAHNFIFVPDVGLIIGNLDISGSLFLNLLSELS